MDGGAVILHLKGEALWLLPERAIFWPARKILLLADLHLGKAGHFRKNGIPIPSQTKDLHILRRLLLDLGPERVLLLGDLFHSEHNREWEALGEVIGQSESQFELVPGNHDILDLGHYEACGIRLLPLSHAEGPFLFTHHPIAPSEPAPSHYVLSGHVHPGVKLVGVGRQRLRLPCFWFGEKQGLLPAFGRFTGLGMVVPEPDDQVFVIGEEKVFPLSAPKRF